MTHPNTTSRRNLAGIGLALALLLVSPLLALHVAAQPPGNGPGIGPHAAFGPGGQDGPPRFLLPRIAELLDLTDAQIAQAKALLEELKVSGEPLREQGEALRAELRELLEGNAPDATAVGTLVIELHGLAEEGRALRDQFEGDFAAILTPEQLERWELAKDLRGFIGGPHGRR